MFPDQSRPCLPLRRAGSHAASGALKVGQGLAMLPRLADRPGHGPISPGRLSWVLSAV